MANENRETFARPDNAQGFTGGMTPEGGLTGSYSGAPVAPHEAEKMAREGDLPEEGADAVRPYEGDDQGDEGSDDDQDPLPEEER